MSTVNERIQLIINELFNGNKAQFSREVEISPTTLNNILSPTRLSKPSSDILENITKNIPTLNAGWLIAGKGEMQDKQLSISFLDYEEPFMENKNGIKYYELSNNLYYMRVPIVPIEAQAKYLNDYSDARCINPEEWEKAFFIVSKIGKGNYLSFEIAGDSMDMGEGEPIPNGSVVLARELSIDHWRDKLNTKRYPNWIIVTETTVLCKQIIHHDTEKAEITCHSLNPSPEYSDFTLCLNDVKGLYNIVQVLKPNHD